jgi:Protein of unknown function (DUF3455)
MKHLPATARRIGSRHQRALYVAALIGACLVVRQQPLHADHVEPPPVPPALEVPAGNRPFLLGHAVGTQNYVCLPSGSGAAWVFFAPQATLFDDRDRQITTHFLSPNPDEGGTARATWQHSRDTSSVWALAVASSSDPAFVEPGAIPWLLLRVVGAEPGPARGNNDRLTGTTFIHRVLTSGGVAPTTGCVQATDVGMRVLVPYTADYVFYEAARRD